MMKHIDIKVADDEKEYKEYGSLYSFAEARLNTEIRKIESKHAHKKVSVCSVTEDWSMNHPRTLTLSVWVQIAA